MSVKACIGRRAAWSCAALVALAAAWPAAAAPVAYWTFDNTPNDSAGSNNGSLVGNAAYAGVVPAAIAGHSTASLELNPGNTVTDYFAAVPTVGVAGAYTVSAWAQVRNPTAASNIFDTRRPAENGFDMKFQNGTTVHGDIGNGSGVWLTTAADAPLNYVTDQWYHLAYVVDKSTYRIFINGAPAASGTFGLNTPTLINATHHVNIGRYSGGTEYFNGYIDDVAVWNTTLNSAQIASLAAGASPMDITVPANKGALNYIPINNDATSQIDPSRRYTHKFDFGTSGVATVNGVPFTQGLAGNQPLINTSLPLNHPGNGTHAIPGTEGVAAIFQDMNYNDPNGVVTLKGLRPGQAYDLRLFVRNWAATGTTFNRAHVLEFDTNGDGVAEKIVRINEDDAALSTAATTGAYTPNFANTSQPYALSYNYIAEANEVSVRLRQIGGGTWHLYGLTNEATDRAPITTLYSTGLDINGSPLPGGIPDPHYLLTAGAQGPTALAVTNHPAWLANDQTSQFISVVEPGTSNINQGLYTYQTSFDLTGYDASTAQVLMHLFSDNQITAVRLNGVSIGATQVGFAPGNVGKVTLTGGFNAGVNTLEFDLMNDGIAPNPGGLRVDLSGTAERDFGPLATGNVSADNHFAVFVGNADGSNLQFVGRNETDWQTPRNLSFAVDSDEYIYIVAWDDPGDTVNPQMLIADITLPDGNRVATGLQGWEWISGAENAHPGGAFDLNALPSLTDLSALISAGIFNPVGAALNNNGAPWGGAPGIAAAFGGGPAKFIWADTLDPVSFSNTSNTYVIYRTRAIPEPTTLSLLALAGAAMMRRRRTA